MITDVLVDIGSGVDGNEIIDDVLKIVVVSIVVEVHDAVDVVISEGEVTVVVVEIEVV